MLIYAYAKINLGLRILGRRSDGFHDIETIFHRVNLYDKISLEKTDGNISLTVSQKNVPADRSNLCWQAAALLKERTGTRSGVSITLQKNIPSGAGLGGGSSDAAAMLRALARLWLVEFDQTLLISIAETLGSDVSYFLRDNSAYATGRGEQLAYFPLCLPYWIVLVCPPVHVSTPWAYAEYSKVLAGTTRTALPLYDTATGTPADFKTMLRNDFEEVVLPAQPAVRAVKDRLTALGAEYALMSGTGASVYGLFNDENSASEAAASFDASHTVAVTPPHFQPE
ncbi:MAG: 4-(cytidine 5'-diphospho)-2-C-methyl-D-erythritol kinase [Ignavibacteriales bacterium]|nr:4-(cytidine 5'-diphospho)-2-C-methyl-D-erythritol kinase [Ignavibacteriales bacterium]